MKIEKYHVLLRIVHWSMAILIIGMIASGLYMEDLTKEDSIRPLLYSLHKSFGVCVLLLFFVRVLLKIVTKIPKLPPVFSKGEIVLAKSGHHILYLLMFAIPVSGFIMSNAAGYGVNVFGYSVVKIFATNKSVAQLAGELHEILSLIMIAILIAHIFAAIKHKKEGGEKNVMKRII